jgi:hypothetical protein
MKVWIKVALVASLIAVMLSAYTITKIKSVAAAYLYGYPLVMMDQSRIAFLGGGQKENQLNHIQRFPDHTFRNVVRPNNDTLYSIAWIDLTKEPLVLTVPDTQGRYYVMPLMDAWTNVFALIGRRTTGTNEGSYAITGPQWQGVLPTGVKKVESPTNMVWLIGRIQTNGASDIANVVALQAQFSLTSLSEWEANVAPGQVLVSQIDSAIENPMEIVESMPADVYFSRLHKLMAKQASLVQDTEALNNLADLGFVIGEPFNKRGLLDDFIFNLAIKITQKKLQEGLDKQEKLENGWVVHRSTIGEYGSNYALRAGAAKAGLGALPVAETVYPNTTRDSTGELLTGSKRYKIRFDKGEAPPINAFWSLSVYDDEGFFVDNTIKRYSIGDRDKLDFNVDGSLDIWIQSTEPVTGQNNWLPTPAGQFALTMRLYSPTAKFISGAWTLPKVESIP